MGGPWDLCFQVVAAGKVCLLWVGFLSQLEACGPHGFLKDLRLSFDFAPVNAETASWS